MSSGITAVDLKHPSSLPFVTCAEMKALEKAADEAGLSYYQMMENAGSCAASYIEPEICSALFPAVSRGHACDHDSGFSQLPGAKSPICNSFEAIPVFIFCGKGNNGGDGLVVARLLSQRGFPVSVVFVEGQPKTPDAMANYKLLPREVKHFSKEMFFDTFLYQLSESTGDPSKNSDPLSVTILVDAIYGTGFHGDLSPEVARIIRWINQKPDTAGQTFVFSLDLPSGLSGDMNLTENPETRSPNSLKNNWVRPVSPGLCVNATHTIAFHSLKPVHLSSAVQPFLGKLVVADIGIHHIIK